MTLQIGQHEWVITVSGQEVCNLFDRNGVETFDPTKAVEAGTSGAMGLLIEIEAGDTIAFERIT